MPAWLWILLWTSLLISLGGLVMTLWGGALRAWALRELGGMLAPLLIAAATLLRSLRTSRVVLTTQRSDGSAASEQLAEALEQAARATSELGAGRLRHDIPGALGPDGIHTVTVTLTTEGAGRAIRLGTTMAVRLTSLEERIATVSSERVAEQALEPGEPTSWTFVLKTRDIGSGTLQLAVDMIEPTARQIEQLALPLRVTASPLARAIRWVRPRVVGWTLAALTSAGGLVGGAYADDIKAWINPPDKPPVSAPAP